MKEIVLRVGETVETIVSWNISEETQADRLASAHKAFFGRKGNIDYATLRATFGGSTLTIREQTI